MVLAYHVRDRSAYDPYIHQASERVVYQSLKNQREFVDH